ncbi:MAG: thioredoxin domain-containing protein, partial [Flavobacterium sp.]|nr:thioredoxin domain-containing protein [Flavobacterium sp.]
MNQLAQETSPYLLQHANNPVYWKAWNPETIAEAQVNQKLLIISIGYSACHWCHVMEHESFEDEEVADLMNLHFTSIKIDREERPDLDAIYMKALQIMTGQGGWPLNIIALPDGRPVWGGTYFRKADWMASLQQLQDIYIAQPEKMDDYAQRLQAGIVQLNELTIPTPGEKSVETLLPLVEKWKKSFDHEFGGMARSPKFMMPNNYAFLLRYAQDTKDQELIKFVQLTLKKMAYGGLFDTVGGGFSRYSVDERWHIPHFEKMAYDNGQLLQLYAQAYKPQKDPLYLEVIQKTMGFILAEWTSAEGGFYSAWDADSLNLANEMEEGAYYVWTKIQIEKLVGADFNLFSQVFNLNEFGHWEHENYVLIQTNSLENIATANGLTVSQLQTKKAGWENTLFQDRLQRSKPGLDDKCLCSWNGLLLSGILASYQTTGDESYLNLALQNAQFIEQQFWQAEGNLCHSYKNGKASINGFLEDYAFVIAAFLELYDTTFNEKWLRHSKQLTDYCLDYFYDESRGLFSFTSRLDPKLVSAHFEIEDNVIPASNSVMAKNLWRLSTFFTHTHYRTIATQMIDLVT